MSHPNDVFHPVRHSFWNVKIKHDIVIHSVAYDTPLTQGIIDLHRLFRNWLKILKKWLTNNLSLTSTTTRQWSVSQPPRLRCGASSALGCRKFKNLLTDSLSLTSATTRQWSVSQPPRLRCGTSSALGCRKFKTFTYWQSVPNFCNHQTVISITVTTSQIWGVKCIRMPHATYHDVTNLSDDCLSRLFRNACIRKYFFLPPRTLHRVIS